MCEFEDGKLFDEIMAYLALFIQIFGLIGNGVVVFVFIQKRFRSHSSSIYLLCLCLSNGLYLLLYLYDKTFDTLMHLRKQKKTDLCLNQSSFLNFSLNKTSELYPNQHYIRFDITCTSVNFLSFALRSFSGYIIMIFTIQRTIAIYSPFFEAKFESKQFASRMVILFLLLSILSSLWVPFLFKLREIDNSYKVCLIVNDHVITYFFIVIILNVFSILVPIIIIFICNSLIICFILKISKKRKLLLNSKIIARKTSGASSDRCLRETRFEHVRLAQMSRLSSSREQTNLLSLSKIDSMTESKPSINTSATTNTRKKSFQLKIPKNSAKESNKITKMLLLMSLSYAVLNLPYFLAWFINYYYSFIELNDFSSFAEKMYHIKKLCEILHILNFSINFCAYCASGKRFRKQLKDALKCRR